ncbi:MAG TPA: hypothetical protein VGF55_05810 [Gemmataceae bacterium]
MYVLVSLADGASGTFFVYYLLRYYAPDGTGHLALSALAGFAVTAGLIALHVVGVLTTTADRNLQSATRG